MIRPSSWILTLSAQSIILELKEVIMKSVIDLIVEAAEKEEVMKKFRTAKTAKDLQDQLKHYSISLEDCQKLMDARLTMLLTLSDPRRGCY